MSQAGLWGFFFILSFLWLSRNPGLLAETANVTDIPNAKPSIFGCKKETLTHESSTNICFPVPHQHSFLLKKLTLGVGQYPNDQCYILD